ncbi:MAG: hypothetical protein DRO14_00950 [Thermoprotei archaeon]|nr:MAG: hypothetical protein DRO14_00950 [Thermoprotei archaeon]
MEDKKALKRLGKAKIQLNSHHARLLELFVYDIIAEGSSPDDVNAKISRLSKLFKWLEQQNKIKIQPHDQASIY